MVNKQVKPLIIKSTFLFARATSLCCYLSIFNLLFMVFDSREVRERAYASWICIKDFIVPLDHEGQAGRLLILRHVWDWKFELGQLLSIFERELEKGPDLVR